ncbi:glucose-6-phosphate isomerase [Kosmotoga arenicorallina S304]|uniref:Glucose-6-phosphate isomerase n=1 Tax=Kosmotoga arenicorallina S304 TaxID=1453497 RepID=A0A176K2C3_9BACT|nr:glucose-6-phosphate isomerase [Kosmotoga arenicorallina]OAA31172.1 glucose-6-phosphate isomerase [Kosmotoga arenicorallina S304]
MLKFDFSLAFKENIGTGPTYEEILERADIALGALNKVIDNQPGFIRILGTEEYIEEVQKYASWFSSFENIVVLGIGGSALGNIALHKSLKPINWNSPNFDREGKARVFVVDNIDPEFVDAVLSKIDLSKTLFNIISKSGTTAEAMANYLIVRGMLDKSGLASAEHLLFTTDPEKGVLRVIAEREGIRTLTIPRDVGGRFSVLTPVGLASAFAEGIDIKALHRGAKKGLERYKNQKASENPLVLNALLHLDAMNSGKRISVMMPYSNRLYLLADWYRQLWAESLGKKFDKDGKEIFAGQTPVKALGAVDQHSQIQLYNEGPKDKIITFLRLETFSVDFEIPALHNDIEALSYLGGKALSTLLNSEQYGTALALAKNGVPSLTITFPELNEENVGEFILYYELLTATMGELLRINPYDQPGVELGKKITYGLMGRKGYEGFLKDYINDNWRLEL